MFKPVILFSAVVLAFLTANTASSVAGCRSAPQEGVDWSGCRKTNLLLGSADLVGANLTRTDFSRTKLDGANLSKSDLTRATLYRAKLKGAVLNDVDLSKVEGNRANFANATIKGAMLTKSEFSRANFAGAELRRVDFSRAELARANFADAFLEDVNFTFSNISRAVFSGVIFRRISLAGSYMFLTKIEGADLRQAEGLTQSQLDIACGDQKTLIPDDLTRPADWPCTAAE